MEKVTDFGFETIATKDKSPRVRQIFDTVAKRYDLMNDLMSGGLHRLWKNAMVARLRPRPGYDMLDLAGGTGDIAFRLLRAAQGEDNNGRTSRVRVLDINHEMLKVGQARGHRKGLSQGLDWLCADAEKLPLPRHCVDTVTIAFGLRNVTDKAAALAEAHRVLKPGGRFFCLEFSQMVLPGLSELYDRYSLELLPEIGARVTGDRDAYRYLAESIRTFPNQRRLAAMCEEAGFARVKVENLSGGIAALHSGWRL